MTIVESKLTPQQASYDLILPAGESWLHEVKRGQVFRILDLEGNQAVDTLFYNAHNPEERYSAVDTIREQGNLYLTAGTSLMSTEGNVLMTIVADTCGRHDTLGRRLCGGEQQRALRHRQEIHAQLPRQFPARARTLWLRHGQARPHCQRELLHERAGDPARRAHLCRRHLCTRKYVEMRAEMDVYVLISNCPQLNNPCNAYNPTPVRLLIWDAVTQ